MIFSLVAIIAVIGLSLIDTNKSTRILDEYCNLECQERKQKKYNFCC